MGVGKKSGHKQGRPTAEKLESSAAPQLRNKSPQQSDSDLHPSLTQPPTSNAESAGEAVQDVKHSNSQPTSAKPPLPSSPCKQLQGSGDPKGLDKSPETGKSPPTPGHAALGSMLQDMAVA